MCLPPTNYRDYGNLYATVPTGAIESFITGLTGNFQRRLQPQSHTLDRKCRPSFFPGQNAKNPQIITSLPGMDTYAIWARSDGTKDVIEFSYTRYYGSSWSNPITLSN